MSLRPGDILAADIGEWRVIGHPYSSADGKTVNVRVESVKQLGAIQLRSWGAHERIASGAGSHPLRLAAVRAGDFAITYMVTRPRKTNVNKAITSRLSNFVNAINSRRSNFGIAHPYARRVMRLRVLQMCGGRAIGSSPQEVRSGIAVK